MAWKKGEDVTFENGLVEDFDNYEIDEHLYREIPSKVYPTTPGTTILLKAIQKSDKLSIRQSARIANSIKTFDEKSTKFGEKSTKLTMWMIRLIIGQSVILIFQLVLLFSR